MVQGQIHDAALADFLDVDTTSRSHGELAAYIAASRVRRAEAVLIVHAFSPKLFTYGRSLSPFALRGGVRQFSQRERAEASN